MAVTFGGVTIPVELHLDIALMVVGLLVGYAALIRRYGPLFHPRPGDRAVTPGQIASFVGGLLALWIASGSPLHDIAERSLFSAHMVQHLLHTLVVPPLLLLGIPRWMGELLLRPPWLRRVVRSMSRPLVAGLVFNGVLLAIHWPAIVDLMLTSELVHGVSHVVVIAAGLAMWMNVVSPVPRLVPRLSPLAQMFYLFLMTLLPTVPASFLTFGEEALYPAYASFPMPWDMTVVEDMRLSGLIMKIGGGFTLWGVITVLFFRWASDEERTEREARRRRPTDLMEIEP